MPREDTVEVIWCYFVGFQWMSLALLWFQTLFECFFFFGVLLTLNEFHFPENLDTFKINYFFPKLLESHGMPQKFRDTESWCWQILGNQVREVMPITRECPLTLREPLLWLPCPVFVVTSPTQDVKSGLLASWPLLPHFIHVNLDPRYVALREQGHADLNSSLVSQYWMTIEVTVGDIRVVCKVSKMKLLV